jgi:hypothetical protein
MTRDNLDALARDALNTFGTPMQMRRFVEECSEAITVIMKCHDNRKGGHPFDVAEEVVGVIITAAQMERWLVGVIGVDALNDIWAKQLAKLQSAIASAR